MTKQAPIVLACFLGTAAFSVSACGPAAGSGSSADPRALPQTQSERDGSLAAHREHFQRELIDSGHDSETRIGEYLTVLELDWRKLQAMPIDEAYTITHEAVMRFPDERVRRQMLLSLFNEKENR
jgi:hypothetical protein